MMVITHLEPDILESEVNWDLGSITPNKPSGGDGIPAEVFQILKDDAVKMLHSICQQIWKTQPTGLENVSFHPNPKERQCQRMFRLLHNWTHLTHLQSNAQNLRARLQQYVNHELPDVQGGFRKDRNQRSNCQHKLDHRKSKTVPLKHLLLLHWLC